MFNFILSLKNCFAQIFTHAPGTTPQVFQTEQGTLRNVLAAVRRGRQVYCRHCGQRGATLGCLLERCPCSYHLPCAQQAGAIFHCLDFTLTCCDHAKLFPRKPEEEG